MRHITKCNTYNKTSNLSVNLSKSNLSISNLDSHKKNKLNYKNSLKQNLKKHQSTHYDNEFSQNLIQNDTFDLYEVGDIQIEIKEILINYNERSQTEFILICSYQNFNWKIKKKFRDFCELFQNISLAFPGINLPDSCKIFDDFTNCEQLSSMQENLLTDKKNNLENFINDLTKIEFIKNSLFFKNFLEIQEKLIHFLKREKNDILQNFHSREPTTSVQKCILII